MCLLYVIVESSDVISQGWKLNVRSFDVDVCVFAIYHVLG